MEGARTGIIGLSTQALAPPAVIAFTHSVFNIRACLTATQMENSNSPNRSPEIATTS